MQDGAVGRGPAGHRDEGAEAGRIHEGDLVQVQDQRFAGIGQFE